MPDITCNLQGEPLPWENSEEKIETTFNCGNPSCEKQLSIPTFCSDECRDAYYRTTRSRARWTLEKMKQWCKEKGEIARQREIEFQEKAKIFSTPPQQSF